MPTLESLPASTYLITLIVPTQPCPVAPVGQLALALLDSGPISGIMLFAFDKSHRKGREKGVRWREEGERKEENIRVGRHRPGRVLEISMGVGPELGWLGGCVDPESVCF